jgi:hypothetical protein
MLDQLERMPATAERDRMLREVRARAVDVDTGVAPTALPPLFEKPPPASDPPARVRRAPKVVAPAPAAQASRPRATPRGEPAKPVQVSPGRATPGAGDRLTLAADDLLSLGDWSSLPPSEAQTGPVPAWRRGLRG